MQRHRMWDIMKNYFKDRDNRILAVMFGITMIVALSPFISRYCINGHDLEYHLLRIEALKEQILIGKPFSKVDTLFFGGAGYASSLFYSDFLLIIPALLRVAGVSIGASYHLFACLCVIASFASFYYCTKTLTGSKMAGLLAGMLVTLCPYHMDDVLVRAAVGEYMAFIFVPFVILAIYNVVYENMSKPWLFVVGFGGTLLSHSATTILCVIVALAIFLIKIRTFIKSPKTILKLVISSVITLALTAYYWLPMLEQFASAKFYVSNNWTDMLDSALDFAAVFSEVFPCLGIFLVFFAVMRVFVSKKDTPLLGYSDILTVIAIVFSIGSSNIMPWERVARFCGFLQFPWRLFIIGSSLLAIADAIVLYAVYEKITKEEGKNLKPYTAKLVIIVAVLMFMGTSSVYHMTQNAQGYYDYSDDYYSYKPFTAAVIAGEWLPMSVTDVDAILDMSEHVVSSTGSDLPFERNKGEVKVDIPVSFDYVDVPFIYYKGYEATLETSLEDSYRIEQLNVSGDGENGFVRVDLTENQKGKLTVRYKGTVIQKISAIVSVLSLLAVVIYLINSAVKSRKKDIVKDDKLL